MTNRCQECCHCVIPVISYYVFIWWDPIQDLDLHVPNDVENQMKLNCPLAHGWMDGWMDGLDGWMDGWMDWEMQGWTGKWLNRVNLVHSLQGSYWVNCFGAQTRIFLENKANTCTSTTDALAPLATWSSSVRSLSSMGRKGKKSLLFSKLLCVIFKCLLSWKSNVKVMGKV